MRFLRRKSGNDNDEPQNVEQGMSKDEVNGDTLTWP
jgi:hypothetical protein